MDTHRRSLTLSVRTLLAGAVDYAGLFPPAGLSMADTVGNYDRYQRSPHAWMLGRLIIPAGRLAEFRDASVAYDGASAWHLSVLLGDDVRNDAALTAAHNETGRARADAVEVRAATAGAVAAIAAAVPDRVMTYVEIAVEPDPRKLIRALARVRGVRLRAKIRTGGVTPDAFPSVNALSRFVRACYGVGIAFKATAGLHHPLRGPHALTYADDSPTGTMHGFLNLFVVAALCYNGIGAVDTPRLLEASESGAITFSDEGVSWEDYNVSVAEIDTARRRLLISFGSCSFEEPIAALQALNLL